MVETKTFEIRWHDTQPVYACSIHHTAADAGVDGVGLAGPDTCSGAGITAWRVATAGGDNFARIWLLHPSAPGSDRPPRIEYRATLDRHTAAVNDVAFSPAMGPPRLATAGDDGAVLLWDPAPSQPGGKGSTLNGTAFPSTSAAPAFAAASSGVDAMFEKEAWRPRAARPAATEIYALAWAPDGSAVAAAGTDFSVRILSATDGKHSCGP